MQSATIGQLTSEIRNKQVRSETYSKLKHIKKVSCPACCYILAVSMLVGVPFSVLCLQKEKKAARERAKKEDAKAEQLGLVVPRKVQRVSLILLTSNS